VSSRFNLALITLIVLLAAFFRITDLSRLPNGFSDEEITSLRISETARQGVISVFYRVSDPVFEGRESVFPILEAVMIALVGDGLFGYRVLPLFLGLINVALVYGLGRRLYGAGIGRVIALIFAVGTLPVLLSRAVLPQSLLLTLSMGMILTLLRGLDMTLTIRPLQPSTSRFAAFGILLALSVYTHYLGVLLIPITILFFTYLRLTTQPISRRVFSYLVFASLLAFITGLPYFLSTMRFPDLSGFGAFWAYRPPTFWHLFIHAFQFIRTLLDTGSLEVSGMLLILFTAALLIAGGVKAVREWQTPGYFLPLVWGGVGLFPVIWMGRADYNLIFVIPSVALLMGVGANELIIWMRKGLGIPMVWRLAGIATLITVVFAGGTLVEFFGRWRLDLTIYRQYHGYLGTLAQYLDGVQDDLPFVICTQNLRGDSESPLSDPRLLEMMMHYPTQSRNLRFTACNTTLVIADGGKPQRIAFTYDQDGRTPDALRGWLSSVTKRPLEIPGARRMAVYEVEGEKQIADIVGKVTLSIVEWPPNEALAPEPIQLPIRMGSYVSFLGYQTDEGRSIQPGSQLPLITYWRIDGETFPADLQVFSHLLLDPSGTPVAQNDGLDTIARYLRSRDIVVQASDIQLPYPFAGGSYYLSVGAYQAGDKTRLPFLGGNNQPRSDRLFCGLITVKD
jgi:4-amino-4-deoxy-L-arabinose transferase-like glycosyltransferase